MTPLTIFLLWLLAITNLSPIKTHLKLTHMNLLVRGPSQQKRITINHTRDLDTKIKEAFDIETYTLSLDPKGKDKVDLKSLKTGQVLYIHYKEEKKNITRPRDQLLCNHGVNAMCSNCAPLDPWDPKYYEEKKIKYLSFASFSEMLKYNKKSLDEENYMPVKCTTHGSNTRCLKCQEKVVNLYPQIYRMVDHIEFDNSQLVENFIKNWRDSGRQVFGLLIGKYMDYENVPLGVKALVSGIWEIKQENYPDGFVIYEEDESWLRSSGLQVVGMIYTDIHVNSGLTSDKLVNDYFLSALEIDFISRMQMKHTHKLENREFNSRFVTIVIAPNENQEIELNEYQVSNQCMALIKANYIIPSENPNKFITEKDIYYRITNDYSKVVNQKAENYVPTTYFIVKLTHGNKNNPLFSNSELIERKCSSKNLAMYFRNNYNLEKFSNFTLLCKIKDHFSNPGVLLEAVVSKNGKMLEDFKLSMDFYIFRKELEKFDITEWNCGACTYLNQSFSSKCKICGGGRE